MQPILYSLIINLAALLVSAGLAWHFNQPLLILGVIAVVALQTHAISRFDERSPHPDEDDDEGRPIGFLTDPDK